MGILDEITQLRRANKSDQEIISALKDRYSQKDINEALNHVQIKNAVSDIQGDEAPMPQEDQGQQDYQSYDNQGQEQYNYDQSQQQTYSPQQPQQQEYYPQQGYAAPGYGEYPQPSTNTDTIVDIAEQVFDEKISGISKRVDAVDEFKTLTQARLEHLNERLKRVEMIIDRLQASILEKVGSYGSSLDSIKKEMSMMQDSFSRALVPLASSQRKTIHAEAENNSGQTVKAPKKKK